VVVRIVGACSAQEVGDVWPTVRGALHLGLRRNRNAALDNLSVRPVQHPAAHRREEVKNWQLAADRKIANSRV
jgi:hypothetical protein